MLPGTFRFWDYGDGTIPADRPECGFRNELCPEDNQGLLYNYYEKNGFSSNLILCFSSSMLL